MVDVRLVRHRTRPAPDCGARAPSCEGARCRVITSRLVAEVRCEHGCMSEEIRLAGQRVRLRSTVPGDGPALIAIRKTDEVRLHWRGEDFEAEFADDFNDNETFRLTIETAGRIIGLVQFAEESDADYRHASVDIYIDPAVHRRGYATEAISTLVDYLFDERGHHRLTIDPAADNTPAIDCYASVGFVPVGVMRSYERCADGSWSDGLLMEMLDADRADTRSESPTAVPPTSEPGKGRNRPTTPRSETNPDRGRELVDTRRRVAGVGGGLRRRVRSGLVGGSG